MLDSARSCLGKKRYPDEPSAWAVATKVWYDRWASVRPYPCHNCGGYHLTKLGAEPRMKEGWRPPAIGARARANQRDQDRRRGRR